MRSIRKSVNFYLQARVKWKGDAVYERPVVLVFNYHGKHLHSLTGLKVSAQNWDRKKQRVKLSVKRATEVNAYLDKLDEKVNDIYYTALAEDRVIDNAYIIRELKGKDRPVEKGFWQHYEEYLSTQKTVIKNSTYRSTVTSRNRFREFCLAVNIELTFADVLPALLSKYNTFLLAAGNTNNTIHSHLKRLRRFMDYAGKLGLHRNMAFKEFNVSERIGTIRFLDMNEVKMLMDIQLEAAMEQKARDLMLFGCFTGMRYSDIANLKKADIREHKFEGVDGIFKAGHIRQVKTAEEIVVPLLPEAEAILERYIGMEGPYALPRLSLQKVNENIKLVGKRAGINALQKVDMFRGTAVETEYIEKHKLLSTHMARKTFITIAITRGLPMNIVSGITGQHPATITKHYLGVARKETFKELNGKMSFK